MIKKALVAGAFPFAFAFASASSAQGYVEILNNKQYYPQDISGGRCTTASCVITVTVVKDGDKCTPKADPEITVLTKYPGTVLWHLKSKGYVFAESGGIAFKYPAPAFGNSARRADDVWQWQVKSPGKKQEYFAYKIVLLDLSTKKQCVVDPGLVTDW